MLLHPFRDCTWLFQVDTLHSLRAYGRTRKWLRRQEAYIRKAKHITLPSQSFPNAILSILILVEVTCIAQIYSESLLCCGRGLGISWDAQEGCSYVELYDLTSLFSNESKSIAQVALITRLGTDSSATFFPLLPFTPVFMGYSDQIILSQ